MYFLLSSFSYVAYDNFYNFDNMAVPSITKSFVFSVDYTAFTLFFVLHLQQSNLNSGINKINVYE